MTIAEREALASAYISKCARRRDRRNRRMARRVSDTFKFLTPFAAGICAIGAALVLI